jgi:Sec-independent protein translocase protein TatA
VDGWTIALAVGMVLIVVLVVLLVVVTVTASKLATKAQAVLVALDEVRTTTQALSELEEAARIDATNGPPQAPSGDAPGGADPV